MRITGSVLRPTPCRNGWKPRASTSPAKDHRAEGDGKVAVSLWLARDPRIQMADGRKSHDDGIGHQSEPLGASGRERRIRVSFEFSAKTEEDGQAIVGLDRAAGALAPHFVSVTYAPVVPPASGTMPPLNASSTRRG